MAAREISPATLRKVHVSRQGFEHIEERNAVAREVCEKLGIRLIDLFAAFDTKGLADFREHLIDMIPLPTKRRSARRTTRL